MVQGIESWKKWTHQKSGVKVQEHDDVFAKSESDIGLSHLIEHQICTGDYRPIKQEPRRLSAHYQAQQ